MENVKKRAGSGKDAKNIFKAITAPVRDFMQKGLINRLFSHDFKPISLGGWCGPTGAIRAASLDLRAYPFDYIRTTFEGVCKCLAYDFKDFFPEKPWVSETIKGCNVYRGRYTSFWYHDIIKPETTDAFERRIERFTDLLRKTKKTVVFTRVVVDIDPLKEFSQIEVFNKIISEKFPNLKYKFVFIIHGQEIGTVQIKSINDATAVWCINRSQVDREMDITDYQEGYKKVIDFVIKRNNWPPKPDTIVTDIKKGNDLWLVDGIPMVK
ncbi:MAG: DUF1796 family putative cysteine peptidase [bacterium]|nr:DUF1796 family putative cysteine peptidase [bacterium]